MTSEAQSDRLCQPTTRQAALLVLHLLDARGSERRDVTRARLTEITIRRLWGRTRVPDEFLAEVQEYLLRAGWCLFWAGSSYAIIKVSSVEGWPRISSKRIADDLHKLSPGHFNFDDIEHLLLPADDTTEEEDDKGE